MIQEEPTSSCNEEGHVGENQHSTEAGQSGNPESDNSSNEVYIICLPLIMFLFVYI